MDLPTRINAPSGYAFDESGDLLADGRNQYLYEGVPVERSLSTGRDAEGRICAVASTPVPGLTIMTGYIYDAGGTRVSKGAISAWSCDPVLSGFQTNRDFILGPANEQLTEMDMNGSSMVWDHTNVWAAGALMATYNTGGGSGSTALHFYLNDPLGTRRAQTDYAGVLEQVCQSLPFGDNLACSGTAGDPTEHHFTGKERDAESGNDYFEARYYASSLGRFLSPDWSAKQEPVPYAKMDNPQSLNLYAYVMNNPSVRMDADGHDCTGTDAEACDSQSEWKSTAWKAQDALQTGGDLHQAMAQQNASGNAVPKPTTFTFNLGGTSVNGTFGGVDTDAFKGVGITADSGCSGCQWVQIVERLGADAHGPQLDNSALSGTPFYPFQDHFKAGSFSDEPGNWKRGDWSVGGGTFSAVAVLGIPNASNHTFKALGAISYGFSISPQGKLTIAPPIAAPGRVSEGMYFMNKLMPSWSGN